MTTSLNPNAIWNAIIALIAAQMGTGGTLSTLLDVRKSAQFSTDLVPAAAVQWMGAETRPYSNRVRLATHHFRIALAANSIEPPPTVGTQRVANLDDAMSALQPLIDDGAGNGIVPLLGQPANFGLGNLAQETQVVKVEMSWEIREGAGQIIWAYAFIDFDAVVQYRSS